MPPPDATPASPDSRAISTEPLTAPPIDPRQRAALLMGLGLVVIWGCNFSVQKAVFTALSPPGFLFARYLIMPLCAVLLLWQQYGTRWPRLPREEWIKLAKLAVLGHILHVGIVTFGIHWSTAFSSSIILAVGPVFTLLFLRWMGVEHLTRAQIAGVAVACSGVLIFLSDKLLGAQWKASSGDLVLLVAASFFSLYTVKAKPLFERHGAVLVTAYTTLLASLPIVLLSLPFTFSVDWSGQPLGIWAGLVWSVVVSAFIGWIVWGWVNGVRGIARTAPLMYLSPPVAGTVAWFATGESYTWIKILGATVTLGGVALAQFAHRRNEPTPEPVTVVD